MVLQRSLKKPLWLQTCMESSIRRVIDVIRVVKIKSPYLSSWWWAESIFARGVWRLRVQNLIADGSSQFAWRVKIKSLELNSWWVESIYPACVNTTALWLISKSTLMSRAPCAWSKIVMLPWLNERHSLFFQKRKMVMCTYCMQGHRGKHNMCTFTQKTWIFAKCANSVFVVHGHACMKHVYTVAHGTYLVPVLKELVNGFSFWSTRK